jgi:Carboxypeptidase regulatory-like domain/Domain of unknown function (DUF4382)
MKAVLLLAALSLAACSAPGSSVRALPAGAAGASSALRQTNEVLGGPPRAQSLSVALYDAPLPTIPGLKVNVGIDGIQLLSAAGATSFVTNAKPQVVNLLDLQSHAQTFKGTAPYGQYTGIRLLIDSTTSNVSFAGHTIPIAWGAPGATTSAPVIAVDFGCNFSLDAVTALLQGGAKVTLDFNVMQSVRYVNGTIYVQPSVTAANMAAQVQGQLKNAAGKPVSSATVLAVDASGKTVNSTVTGNDGKFVIHALPAGMYTIQVKNSYVTSAGETITAVNADSGAAPSAFVVLSPEDDLELDTLVD